MAKNISVSLWDHMNKCGATILAALQLAVSLPIEAGHVSTNRASSHRLPLTGFGSPGSRAFSYTSGFDVAFDQVIRDQRQWKLLWSTANEHTIPSSELPGVSFDSEYVLVSAMGTQPSGGYSVSIVSAEQHTDYIEILVRDSVPGNGCTVITMITHPADFARLPKTLLPIRFRHERFVRSCS